MECDYVLKSKHYNKSDFIGRGSFGEVFIVEKDGKSYAMKIMKLSALATAMNSEPNFLNEVKIAKIAYENRLGPEVIDWWICGLTHKYGVLVIEKLKITLADYLKNENIPKYKKLCIVVKCLNKMKKLHKVSICHGDVSRQFGNIMLDDNDEPYFIDFGSSLIITPNKYWCVFFEMKNFLEGISKWNIFSKIFSDRFIYDFTKESKYFRSIEKDLTFEKILKYEEEYYNSSIKFIEDNLFEIIS